MVSERLHSPHRPLTLRKHTRFLDDVAALLAAFWGKPDDYSARSDLVHRAETERRTHRTVRP